MKGGTKSGVTTISLGRLQYIRWVTAGHTQETKTNVDKSKGKAIRLQPWAGPEGSRRLRLPDFKTVGT
jgi:hypothetical protein